MQPLDKSSVVVPDGWHNLTDMLPTKGRFYKNQALIAKPYSYSEMEAIVGQSEYSQVEAFTRAVTGLKFLPAIGDSSDPLNVTEMFLGDILFALLYRKVITLGEQDFTLSDPLVGWTAENISMEKIEVKDMEAPDLPATVVMPSSGKTVSFWPLTLGDVLQLLDRDSEALPTLSTYIKIMTRGQLTADEVVGQKDSDLVEKIDAMFSHGFEPLNVKMKNSNGEEVDQEINLNSSLFVLVLPFRPDGDDQEPEISFGSTSQDSDTE